MTRHGMTEDDVAAAYDRGYNDALETAAIMVEEDGRESWWWALAERIRGRKRYR